MQGICPRSGNSFKVGERPKVRERSANPCSQGNLIVAAEQNNSRVIYLYCKSFFIRDVHGEFGLINVRLLDILPAILSGKAGNFFCLERGNPGCKC